MTKAAPAAPAAAPSPAPSSPAKKRLVAYARFSTDEQNDTSIDDQFSVCRVHAGRNEIEIVATFEDRAKSSATLEGRPGAMRMLQMVREQKCDGILVQNFDRLSREPIDSATIWNIVDHADGEILTVNEGKMTRTSVLLRGVVGDMILRDMADHARRHHAGCARRGEWPGHAPYGYRKAGRLQLEIEPAQAAIIVRIYSEYAADISPRAIAAGLNRDGIASPHGKQWNAQSFASVNTGNGILTNTAYIGKAVWGRTKRTRHPDQRTRRVKKLLPEAEWITVDCPRIVDQSLWERAQEVRNKRATHKFGSTGRRTSRGTPRSRHMLAGLLVCGECGAPMRICGWPKGGGPRAACSAAATMAPDRPCDHGRSYDMDTLQQDVANEIVAKLRNPEALQAMFDALHATLDKEQRKRKRRDEAAVAEKRLADIEAQIDRLMTALQLGLDDKVTPKLEKLAHERRALQQQVRLGGGHHIGNVTLHPKIAKERLRSTMARFIDGLQVATLAPETIMAFRIVVDAIKVYRAPKKKPNRWETFLREGALTGELDLFPSGQNANEIMAERARRVSSIAPSPGSQACRNSRTGNRPKIISLGRSQGIAA
jgi:site-specific DNA recombinase